MDKSRSMVVAGIIMSSFTFLGCAAVFVAMNVRIAELDNQTNAASGTFVSEFASSEDGGTIEQVAEEVASSVVSIVTKSTSTSRFYGEYESSASGSGIIVSKDGYILTNKHVANGGESFAVYLDDGRSFTDVKLVATDSLNDVAFLKINGVDNLPAAELGDSKNLQIGQSVIAIGNALGEYQNTVTAGIISGIGRSITAGDNTYSENLTDMIQTDASINQGNSGGPLVNAAGQVIGINTAVSADGQGIGFAIPISAAKGMLVSLLENGSAGRAYIGVQYVEITSEVASEYKLPVSRGAYVYINNGSAVVTGGPAEKAGIKNGDIIVAVNGYKVGESGSLGSLIAEHQVGEEVKLTILRDGNETTINVKLEAEK